MKIIFLGVEKKKKKKKKKKNKINKKKKKKHKKKTPKEKIIETLQKPDKITSSLEDENTRYYYKYYKNLQSNYNFVKVIAKYLNGKGSIISSHFVRTIR